MQAIRPILLGLAAAFCLYGAALADNLRIGVQVEPSSIDPHFHNVQPNLQIARQIFDFLLTRGDRQELGPGLAESWKRLDDKTWEINLRKGVKFHDGSPFTADDVIFSAQRVPNVPNSPGGYGTYILGKKLARIDDFTIRITTDQPTPLMLADLSTFAILSKKHAEKAATDDFNKGTAAVGTGPFRFVEWVRGDRLVIEANKDYWGEKATWDRVTYKPISSNGSRVAALLSGDVDLIDNVPLPDIEKLKANPKLEVSQSPSNRMVYFSADSGRAVSPFVTANDGTPLWPNPLRDGRVRKAISLAINRAAIAERIMSGAAIPAGQLVPDGFYGQNPDIKVPAADPAQARKLLADAGYPQGFRLTIHSPRDRYPNDAAVAQAVAQMLTQVGIRTELQVLAANIYFTRASKLEFSMGLFANGSDTGEASAPLNSILSTYNAQTGAGLFNRGRYSNVDFDAKMQEALTTLDDARREALLREATTIAISDYAMIPTHFQTNTWAMRKGLRYVGRTDENTLPRNVVKAD